MTKTFERTHHILESILHYQIFDGGWIKPSEKLYSFMTKDVSSPPSNVKVMEKDIHPSTEFKTTNIFLESAEMLAACLVT